MPRSPRQEPYEGQPWPHTLGTSGGGFGPIRGKVIDALLTTCQEAVRDARIDIVIVAETASDYTAFQSRRRELKIHERHLGPELTHAAERLAELAIQVHLALFLGAGVGIPAGLPTWKGLLEVLGASAGEDFNGLESDLDKAELLHIALGDRFGTEVASSIKGIRRYAITHAMLASGATKSLPPTTTTCMRGPPATSSAGAKSPRFPSTRRSLTLHGSSRCMATPENPSRSS